MTSDLDLLTQFASENSQDAFGEIVRRHVDLVYSAALRQVRSPQLAEEVTQSVFADLARDARKLRPDTVLTAWLYAVARRTAIDVIRKESRRQLREQIAVEMNNMNATADDWGQIAPLLDDAMAALDENDRAAVLLRYFENKSLREVGESLKISDDAAQKRVSRAVERLREFFSKQRLTIDAGGLSALISANAVQSAPVELRVTISAIAVKTVAGIGLGTKGLALAKIGTILGSAAPFLPIMGSFYFTFKARREAAKSPRKRQPTDRYFWIPRERRPMDCYFWIRAILIVILTFLIFKFFSTSSLEQTNEALFSAAIIFVLFGLLFSFVTISKKRRQIQIEDGTWVEAESVTDKERKELWANVWKNGSKKIMYTNLSQACIFLYMTMKDYKPGFNGNWKHTTWLIFLIGFMIFSGIQAWRSRPR